MKPEIQKLINEIWPGSKPTTEFKPTQEWKLSERQLQQQLADYLKIALMNNDYWTAIPAGDGRATRAPGYNAGAPDVIVLHDGLFIGLELKSKTGKQSLEQYHTEQKILAAGGKYKLVRSVREAHDFLALCGVPLKVRITA